MQCQHTMLVNALYRVMYSVAMIGAVSLPIHAVEQYEQSSQRLGDADNHEWIMRVMHDAEHDGLAVWSFG